MIHADGDVYVGSWLNDRASGKGIFYDIQVCTHRLAGLDTKVSGKRTSNTDMGRRLGLMRLFIREIINTERNTVRANLCGRMIVATKAISLRTISMVLENTYGTMVGPTRASGKTTKWRVRVFSHGWMEGDTKVSTKTIRRKVLGYFFSEMEGCMRVSGKMGSNMAGGYSKKRMYRGRGYGRTGRELSGWIRLRRTNQRTRNLKIQNDHVSNPPLYIYLFIFF